jgi:hypothetical protein
MEKPTARGPSPHRKAERALRSQLNRQDKPPPVLPEKMAAKTANVAPSQEQTLSENA